MRSFPVADRTGEGPGPGWLTTSQATAALRASSSMKARARLLEAKVPHRRARPGATRGRAGALLWDRAAVEALAKAPEPRKPVRAAPKAPARPEVRPGWRRVMDVAREAKIGSQAAAQSFRRARIELAEHRGALIVRERDAARWLAARQALAAEPTAAPRVPPEVEIERLKKRLESAERRLEKLQAALEETRRLARSIWEIEP